MRKINKVIVHCSDTPPSMDIGVDEIREWHMAAPRNWDDVGYHYVIRRNGDMETGRALDVVGAHCFGENANSIGICIVGGRHGAFDFKRIQLGALDKLIDLLMLQLPDGFEVHGHNEFSDKTCPNFNVSEWWY